MEPKLANPLALYKISSKQTSN